MTLTLRERRDYERRRRKLIARIRKRKATGGAGLGLVVTGVVTAVTERTSIAVWVGLSILLAGVLIALFEWRRLRRNQAELQTLDERMRAERDPVGPASGCG